jgi:mitogen-activated protein kinase 1/3
MNSRATDYQLIHRLGEGTYGKVYKAKCISTNKIVSIKQVELSTQNDSVYLIDLKRLLREIKLLRMLKGHPNIVSLETILERAANEKIVDLVFEYSTSDLMKLIKSHIYLTEKHAQFIFYQILRGIHYLHSADILHRDLKPANILIDGNSHIKICDFNLSRASLGTRRLTEYVTTRWYRAPEIILISEYGFPADMWSAGCILADLLEMQSNSGVLPKQRRALFPGGYCTPLSPTSENDRGSNQLDVIFDILGTPSTKPEDLAWVNPGFHKQLMALEQKQPCNLKDRFPGANPLAIDLLKKLLVLDPTKRITAEAALNHPFLQPIVKEFDCPLQSSPLSQNAPTPDLTAVNQYRQFEMDCLQRAEEAKLKRQNAKSADERTAEIKKQISQTWQLILDEIHSYHLPESQKKDVQSPASSSSTATTVRALATHADVSDTKVAVYQRLTDTKELLAEEVSSSPSPVSVRFHDVPILNAKATVSNAATIPALTTKAEVLLSPSLVSSPSQGVPFFNVKATVSKAEKKGLSKTKSRAGKHRFKGCSIQ